MSTHVLQAEFSERDERSLACKVCTFAVTGSNFTEQHWYYCYTCGLTQSEGCCSICVKVCHRGHIVSYSRRSRFFCDCGAGAAATRGITCSALLPRRYQPPERASIDSIARNNPTAATTSTDATAASSAKNTAQKVPSGGDDFRVAAIDEGQANGLSGVCLKLSEEARRNLLATMASSGFVQSLFGTFTWLLRALQRTSPSESEPTEPSLFSPSKTVCARSDLLALRHSVRPGSFDLKQKSDGAQGRELRTLLGTGVLTRSLLAVSSKGFLALAELDKVHILDSQPLFMNDAGGNVSSSVDGRASAASIASHTAAAAAAASSTAAEKTGLRSLCKTPIGFEVVAVRFNPADEQQLLVVGLKDCVALTIGSRGEIVGRLTIDLMLDALGLGTPVHITSASWLPGSSSKCVVLTNHFVKVYDLAKDKISPIHYFQVLDDAIKDVAFVPNNAEGCLTMLALSGSGILYSQPLTADTGNGPIILTEMLQTPPDLRGRVGACLHYSPPAGILFTVFADGRCFGLRLNDTTTQVTGGFAVHSTRIEIPAAAGSSPPRIAPFLHWQDVPGHRGLIVATCRKTLLPLAIRLTPTTVEMNVLKPYTKAEGICTAAFGNNGGALCWVVHEDGSMQCHQCGNLKPSDDTLQVALKAHFAKRTPRKTLSFPVDFFEQTTCVTSQADISFGGDVLHSSTVANAKARLSSNTEDYVSSPHRNTLKLTISNANKEQVIVGVRVLLGSAHSQHIPANITLFNRVIPTREGQRKWYDIPFLPAEAVLGQSQIELVFSGTHSGASVPVLDAVEVYAQSRTDFGWDAQTAILTARHCAESRSSTHSGGLSAAGGSTPDADRDRMSLLRALQGTLRQLASFHALVACGRGIGKAAPLREEMLSSVPVLLASSSHRQLRPAAKLLLHQLLPDQSEYHLAKDEALLTHALAAVGVSARANGAPTVANLTPTGLSTLVQTLHKLVNKRPQNVIQFLQANPSLLSDVCCTFRALYGATGSRFPNPTTSIRCLVHLVLTCASHALVDASEPSPMAAGTSTAAQLAAVRPHFELLFPLLLSGSEALRFMMSSTLSRLLLSSHSRDGSNSVGLGWGSSVTAHATPGNDGDAVSGRCESFAGEGDGNGGGDEAEVEETLAEDEDEDEEAMEIDEIDEAEQQPHLAVPTNEPGGVQFCCDLCGMCPIVGGRWHCSICRDFDLCDACYEAGEDALVPPHTADHPLTRVDAPPELAHADVSVNGGGGSVAGDGGDNGDNGDGGDGGNGGDGGDGSGDESGGVMDGPADSYEAPGDSDVEEEERMLAMAVAMSLGAVPSSAGERPAPEVLVGATATEAQLPSPYGAAMTGIFTELALQHLPQVAGSDGLTALPFLQLLHKLVTHGQTSFQTWIRLTDAAVDHIIPAIKGPHELNLAKRTGGLELHILLLLLLVLLFHKERRETEKAPPRDSQASSTSVYAASPTRDVRRRMQTELATHLSGRGLPELLYMQAHRLYEHFKEVSKEKPAETATAGNSGLLAVKHQLPPSRTLVPFFSDAYAKTRIDPFDDCQRLLLDATLRLAQRINQPTIRSSQQQLCAHEATFAPAAALTVASTDERDDRVPEWLALLCHVIHSSATTFVRKQAKKHLLQLCGSKTKYSEVRDSGLADTELRRVRKLLMPSQQGVGNVPTSPQSSPEAVQTEQAPVHLQYEQQLRLCASLQKLLEMATAQPRNWARYCARTSSVADGTLCFLLRSLFLVQDEALLVLLRVLNAALKLPSSEQSAVEPNLELSGCGHRVEIALHLGPALSSISVERYVLLFMLQGDTAAIRQEACAVMHALWIRSEETKRAKLFVALRAQLPGLPLYGANCREMLKLLGSLIRPADSTTLFQVCIMSATPPLSSPVSSHPVPPTNLPVQPRRHMASCSQRFTSLHNSLLPRQAHMASHVIDSLIASVKEQNTVLTSHPNAHLYNSIGGLLEMDGHFLESEPLHTSNQPEVPSHQV